MKNKEIEEKEVRTIKTESRIEEREDGKYLIGHAAVFNVEAVINTRYGSFRELVEPGAFREAIAQDDIRALFNHNEDIVLGRNRSGTLKIWEDETGLAYEVNLPETQGAKDLKISVGRGDVSQGSFSFNARGEGREVWERSKSGGLDLRRIINAKLMDIGPVTFPAYEKTDVAVRSHQEWRKQIDDPEEKSAFELVVEPDSLMSLRRHFLNRRL